MGERWLIEIGCDEPSVGISRTRASSFEKSYLEPSIWC